MQLLNLQKKEKKKKKMRKLIRISKIYDTYENEKKRANNLQNRIKMYCNIGNDSPKNVRLS